jgi:hypothetical protein
MPRHPEVVPGCPRTRYPRLWRLFTACSTSTNTGNPLPSREELYLAGDMPGASRRLEGGGST